MSPNDRFMQSLTDEQLLLLAETSYSDLVTGSGKAALEGIDEDWADCCFAALYVCCEEMNKRGLKRNVECV